MKTRNIIILVFSIVIINIIVFNSVDHKPTPPSSAVSTSTTSSATSTHSSTSTSDLSKVYENKTEGFSIRYPNTFTLDSSYKYMNLGPGKTINGVKFTIPASMAMGTNLGADSYVSVEEKPNDIICSANQFLILGYPTGQHSVTENGTTYSVGSTTDAGAGNRYEETVFAIPGTNPCIAVRYYIHYGVFENYPQDGSVKQFDHSAIISQFDQIRKTLVVSQ